jgi:hypothetical protein
LSKTTSYGYTITKYPESSVKQSPVTPPASYSGSAVYDTQSKIVSFDNSNSCEENSAFAPNI